MKHFHRLVIVVLLFVLSACGGTAEPDPISTATTAAPPTALPTDPPTAVPTNPPTVPPTEPPTAAPTDAPTEEPTATPTAAPEPVAERIGVLRFRDSESTLAGKVLMLANNFPPAPAGSHYELWLVDSAEAVLNLGEFVPDNGAVRFEAERDSHLLGQYGGAFISIEPDSNASGEIGLISASGEIPAGSLLHIRHVIYQFAGNPEGQGFLNGARSEIRKVADHAQLLTNEIDASNLPEARRHAEHVINIINGENSAVFGDLDGDGLAQNPGDGVGLITYLLGAKEHANLAANADDASFEVQLHNGHVQISADNALLWLADASAAAVQVISADSAAEASSAAKALAILVNSAEFGEDADGDGNVAPVEGEGGLLTAWEHALNMGSVELVPSEGLVLDLPAPVADDAADDQVEEVDEVAAEAAAVDMLDFSFGQQSITVQPGTTVTWNNVGNARHSAKADDGSFDTGLYAGGEARSITFDAPGTYNYYCELHGGPDLQGMSATIIVAGEPQTDAAESAPTEVPDEPVVTPEATATPESVTAAASVNMEDFEFVSNSVTVKPGTVVTWSNVGNAPHSVKSDDGFFDTGLYNGGESRSITFDNPGTYQYFCELHGQAGGGGMSGVIVVEE